ncbi:MAG: MATE family efflux transporter, partial [Canibacter sp.]
MRQLDRKILALAVPALGALVAEPLFIAVDTAMVGHLGASALAGLSIASTILQTVVGLMVFLAYATTPIVARKLGARDFRGAVQGGVDGLYLAGGLGVVLAALLLISHRIFVGMFGLDAAATEAANTYLVISLAGLPAMLIVFAATGLLRGLQDTRT